MAFMSGKMTTCLNVVNLVSEKCGNDRRIEQEVMDKVSCLLFIWFCSKRIMVRLYNTENFEIFFQHMLLFCQMILNFID